MGVARPVGQRWALLAVAGETARCAPSRQGRGRETCGLPARQKRHVHLVRRLQPRLARRANRDRPAREVAVVVQQPDRERHGELARARAEILAAVQPAALAHPPHPAQRLQRADQHRGAHALLLADRVQQRVDAVGAVDVGAAGAAEQRAGARGEPDVGVAGRLVLVVGLCLDDHAGGGAVFDDAADQIPGHLQHRAPVELDRQRARRRAARRAHGEAGGGGCSGHVNPRGRSMLPRVGG
jgi:hypothetical protein